MGSTSVRATRALPLVLLMALAASSPRPAHAQAPPQSQAETLFAEGRELLEKGKFTEACAKLAKSEELAPGVGTLLNLAYCYEQIGKLRSALDAYAEAETLAIAGADSKRAAFAKERYAAVEPRAAKVIIRVVPPEVPGLEIRRNGTLLAKADFDHPIAVDPQDYVITAAAPGRTTWKGAFIVRGEGAVVTVLVPPLGGTTTGVYAAAPVTAEPAASPLTLRRWVALGLGGVSAVALGAGVALAFSAKSRHGDADSHCGGGCDETGAALQSSAVAQGNLATVIIGLALLAGGGAGYLWFVTPENKPAPRTSIAVSPLGATIGGHF